MAAVSADRAAKRSDSLIKAYAVAATTTIYKGTLVGVNSAGYLVSMSDASSLTFVGVAFEGKDNSAGLDGAVKCRVYSEGEFEFGYIGGDATIALVGDVMYAQTNADVDEDVGLTTNDYPVGFCVEVVSTTKVRVRIASHVRAAGTVATGDIANSAVTTDKIAANNVTAAKLTATLRTGYVPLPLEAAREIASNDIPATAANAGELSSNTTPILGRVNGATDKKLRVTWASSNSDEIVWDFAYPPDLDDTAAVTVNLLAASAGATDTPVIAVSYFEGVGDTNAGGNTGALSASIQHLTVAVAAADIAAYPTGASIGLVVGAHTTDAVHLYGAWVTYTRK